MYPECPRAQSESHLYFLTSSPLISSFSNSLLVFLCPQFSLSLVLSLPVQTSATLSTYLSHSPGFYIFLKFFFSFYQPFLVLLPLFLEVTYDRVIEKEIYGTVNKIKMFSRYKQPNTGLTTLKHQRPRIILLSCYAILSTWILSSNLIHVPRCLLELPSCVPRRKTVG